MENGSRKSIHVAAAIIINEKGEVLCCRRGYGEQKGFYEFPGGKVEPGENVEDALKREIEEELRAEIEILSFYEHVSYDYPKFHLEMDCFLCRLLSPLNPDLTVEDVNEFLPPIKMKERPFLPADDGVIEKLMQTPLASFLL